MEGVGDMSWDNSGDVVDIDEEECWRNSTHLWYTFSHLHTVTKVSVHLYSSWPTVEKATDLLLHPS